MQTESQLNTKKWFYTFAFLHLTLWTLIPYIFRHNIPLDAVEAAAWGHQLQWGYDKHPYLSAWVAGLAAKLGGTSPWTLYFTSQVAVVTCFWAVWQLARRFLTPIHALIAVFILEGIQYYTHFAVDFNNNILEMGLWALASLYFYDAVKHQSVRAWIFTGALLGLAFVDKYFSAILILSMLLFLLNDKKARESFKHHGVYIGVFISLIFVLPNALWLIDHDFISIRYAMARTSDAPTLLNHITHPLLFAADQFGNFLGALVLFAFIYFGARTAEDKTEPTKISNFDKRFLFFVGIGPFIITTGLSAITGMRLYSMWGAPLLSLWGIILLAWLQPTVTRQSFLRFSTAVYSVFALVLVGYSVGMLKAKNPSRINFPGKQIATSLTTEWQEKYKQPLKFVAGPRWFAANVTLYSEDHPQSYFEWNPTASAWIDETKLKQAGAVFIWDANISKGLPKSIQKRFPSAKVLPEHIYQWKRNNQEPKLKVGLAFLPPSSSTT